LAARWSPRRPTHAELGLQARTALAPHPLVLGFSGNRVGVRRPTSHYLVLVISCRTGDPFPERPPYPCYRSKRPAFSSIISPRPASVKREIPQSPFTTGRLPFWQTEKRSLDAVRRIRPHAIAGFSLGPHLSHAGNKTCNPKAAQRLGISGRWQMRRAVDNCSGYSGCGRHALSCEVAALS